MQKESWGWRCLAISAIWFAAAAVWIGLPFDNVLMLDNVLLHLIFAGLALAATFKLVDGGYQKVRNDKDEGAASDKWNDKQDESHWKRW